MRIIMGIFSAEHYDPEKYNALGFKDLALKFRDVYSSCESLRDFLYYLIRESQEIVFILDGIYTPIDYITSHTCYELKTILECDKYFDKTSFYLEGKLIDKHIIREKYLIFKNYE